METLEEIVSGLQIAGSVGRQSDGNGEHIESDGAADEQGVPLLAVTRSLVGPSGTRY